jgi:tetratricopeptide (TPR) repeat protein
VLLLGQFVLGATTTVTAQTFDTARLFREARRSAQTYEFAVRRHAPLLFAGSGPTQCDEYVGRFCITFDGGRDSLPTEPTRVRIARDTAIARLARAARHAPAQNDIVFSLLRYLVQARKYEKAVEVARNYASAAGSAGDGHMALGFALHHAGRTEEAAAELEAWLAALPEADQAKMRDLGWMLSPRELQRYRAMSEAERASHEARVWKYADPLFSTPGNELWTDHLARYTGGRMIREGAAKPMSSWGADVEQLIVRFGETVLMTRSWRTGGMGMGDDYTEHWDPSQRTYLPPELDSALVMRAPLDTIWPLEGVPTRSGHAPPTIRKMSVLEHQAAVFGDQVRLVGVAVAGDTSVKKPLAAAVFFLDSALNVIHRAEATGCLSCVPADSAMLIADVPLPQAALYYSAELYDSDSRHAARARYRLKRPTGPLSGILLAGAFEPDRLPATRDSELLKPLSRPVIRSGERFGIYAEIDNRSGARRTARVEIEMARLQRGSAIGRAVGWVSNVLGVTSPRTPARLGWDVELEPEAVTAVPVTLDPGHLEAGTYRITMTLKGEEGSGDTFSTRDFAVVSSRLSSSPPP